MVRYEQVKKGIANYADREIINKLPDGTLKKVLIGSAVAIAINKADDILNPYLNSDIASQMEIVKDGQIDIDSIASAMKQQITAHGLKVDLPGGINLSFKPEDIDVICRDITEA